MSELRTEAYGGAGFQGPMPAKVAPSGPTGPSATSGTLAFNPGANRPLLGNNTARVVTPRATMLPRPSSLAGGGAPAGPTAPSYAGFSAYFDEQIAGSPAVIKGTRGKRADRRFTEGPLKGETTDTGMIKSRERYAALSPNEKLAYENKARMSDIAVPMPVPTPAGMGPGPIDPGTGVPIGTGVPTPMGVPTNEPLLPLPALDVTDPDGYEDDPALASVSRKARSRRRGPMLPRPGMMA